MKWFGSSSLAFFLYLSKVELILMLDSRRLSSLWMRWTINIL